MLKILLKNFLIANIFSLLATLYPSIYAYLFPHVVGKDRIIEAWVLANLFIVIMYLVAVSIFLIRDRHKNMLSTGKFIMAFIFGVLMTLYVPLGVSFAYMIIASFARSLIGL